MGWTCSSSEYLCAFFKAVCVLELLAGPIPGGSAADVVLQVIFWNLPDLGLDQVIGQTTCKLGSDV